MTASAVGASRRTPAGGGTDPAGNLRPLLARGVIAAGVVTGCGLAAITVIVLTAWIAAPHQGVGLPSVFRTAAGLWLVGHHVGFALHGTGRIGMLPLGLVLLPGVLLWRAGRWLARTGPVERLRHVGYAALALAIPYALLTAALAVVSRSGQFAASVPQAVLCGLLLALVAGGLGAARALAPWAQLLRLLPERQRAVVVALAGSLAVLTTAGALLAGASLAVHLHEAAALQRSLGGGWIGMLLLLLLQIGYVPNAVVWAVAYVLGPGFAFGTGTVVATTGAALGPLPAVPLLAALPPGVHEASPAWVTPLMLALPYLAGVVGGWLLIRAGASQSIEGAAVSGLAMGVLAGLLLGLLAAFSGGPLGDGRLAAVGPSAWQVAAVAMLEIGIAAGVSAGVGKYIASRRTRQATSMATESGLSARATTAGAGSTRASMTDSAEASGHVIYIDPWAGEQAARKSSPPAGPSTLPDHS